VFLNFRGQDTRYSFIDHLYGALPRNKITVFKDDKDLNRDGESIVTDMFVSFCGQDTRHSFTDHLYGALRRNKITVFRDDKDLNTDGESI
jgi:hypothetical protein